MAIGSLSIRHAVALFIFCIVCLTDTTNAEVDPQTVNSRLGETIDKSIQKRMIVGAAVIVASGAKIIFRHATGYADLATKRPMTVDTVFRLSSLSKLVTCTAAMILIDQGKLHLDDPVTKWLPDFKPRVADGSIPAITIRQLLTHTAGLSYDFLEPQDGPYHRGAVSSGLDQPGLSESEELKRIVSAGLIYEPGTQWHYSVSIDVLGMIIEKVTGDTLPGAIRTLVSTPLGLVKTGFVVKNAKNLATPYVLADSRPTPMSDPYVSSAGVSFSPHRVFDATSFASGGGGMVGTPAEFERLLATIVTGGGAILKPQTAAMMMINQTGSIQTAGPGWSFGFGGAVLTNANDAETSLPNGTWTWGGVYGHKWFADPIRKLSLVIFTTSPEQTPESFFDEIKDVVFSGQVDPN